MGNDIGAPDREELRQLMLRWQRGEITFYQVVDEAETIEDNVWSGVDVIEFPPNDPRSIPSEIVGALSMGHVHPLFLDDIPYLLDCLDAPPGREDEFIERLWTELDRVDQNERLERAQRLYAMNHDAG